MEYNRVPLFHPYSINPLSFNPNLFTLYHLTPLCFNSSIISPRFYSFYKIMIILSFGHASRAMAMPQWPVVFDMQLSEPKKGLVYPLVMSKHALISTANWRDEMIEG